VIRARADGGQAAVELVALVPVVAALALIVLQALAGGSAATLAGHAAEAGAVAVVQGRDPRAAARDAVPGWSRAGLSVHVDGGAVRVRLRPPALSRALGERLAAEAEATVPGAGGALPGAVTR
jgi:hypothetical protein